MKLKNIITAFLFSGILLTSCDDFFNVNPDVILLEEDYPSTVTELYSGYIGISSKVQAVADQAIFLEGLRGDFLEPTQNATNDMIDLYNYRETTKNELADPKGYYEVILNANDYIKHAAQFYSQNPTSIEKSEFKGLVAGALRYKCWAYLMLAKIYGQAAWVDDTLAEYQDISSYEVYGFDAVIQKCIELLETGVMVNGLQIDGKASVRWADPTIANSVLNSTDLKWNRYCPPADCLLAELYLFAGQYQKVVDHGFAMLRIGIEDGITRPSYQLTKSEWAGEWNKIFADFVRTEAIFLMYYDYDKKQTNRVMNYFSNNPVNSYLLRPSQAAMDRFNNQVRSDGNLSDIYRGVGKTFKQESGEWVVQKYTSGREASDKIYRNDAPINLCRAADVHLWLAEALVNLGRLREGMIFLEGGIAAHYNATTGAYINEVINNEVVAVYSDFPLSLIGDGKDANISQGVRGRVTLKKQSPDIINNSSLDINMAKQRLDSLIVEETCLELAGEARAYYTMMRVAKRWNNPEILANRVSAKYVDKERMKSVLLDPNNWFIKYDLK